MVAKETVDGVRKKVPDGVALGGGCTDESSPGMAVWAGVLSTARVTSVSY